MRPTIVMVTAQFIGSTRFHVTVACGIVHRRRNIGQLGVAVLQIFTSAGGKIADACTKSNMHRPRIFVQSHSL